MAILVTSRYFLNQIIGDRKGQSILSTWTAFHPEELKREDDIQVELKLGDRLDKLSFAYLGSEQYWWVIAMLNGMKHFWDFKYGDKILIPASVNRFMSYIRTNIRVS